MGALIFLSYLQPISSYSVNYFDCHKIDKLTTYRIGKACEHGTTESNESKKYTVLQKRTVQEMKGYSCKVTRSTLTEYCGAYSHTKLAKTPDVEVTYGLNPSACLDMVNTGVFTTPGGQRRPISLNAENVIKSEHRGTLTIGDDSVSCRGQSMKFDNNFIVNDILEVSQYKVTVMKVKFLISEGHVETLSDHLRLPQRCSVSARGCKTFDTTYVWIPPRSTCDLEEV